MQKQMGLNAARAMLRLRQEIQAETDSLSRQLKLLESLCILLRAGTAECTVTRTVPGSRRPIVLSCVQTQPIAQETTSDVNPPGQTQMVAASHATSPAYLRSEVVLADTDVIASVQVCREGARFSQYDRELVDLVHREMLWIYEKPLPGPTTGPVSREEGLSRRQRQTLEHLLNGDSEKQTALKLKLSPNTIHHYVRGIYRHYAVSSRGELLAYVLGNAPATQAPTSQQENSGGHAGKTMS